MSPLLLAIVTGLYAGVAISEARIGNWPMVVVFVGYAMGNIGLILSLGR